MSNLKLSEISIGLHWPSNQQLVSPFSIKDETLAFISYLNQDQIPESDRVPDQDNIIQVHGVHSRIMRMHYDLYIEVMHRESPLSRVQREMVAVAVSAINGCEY